MMTDNFFVSGMDFTTHRLLLGSIGRRKAILTLIKTDHNKTMKNYYFNPKTQDLHIFDPEAKEMLVLERIEGIRVLTSSEIDRPVREDTEYKKHNWNPVTGKAKKFEKRAKSASKPAKKSTRAARKLMCKNCGGEGHFAKTCKNPAKLPASEIGNIVQEERAIEPITT
jgi:hypothetical protein